MEVVLLGTGSADGWPNPFCSCASCNDARECGQIRGQTAALVDGALLIDCGPEIPRAAARLGHRLDSVTTLLFTHAHPDHVGPAALLFRHWAKERRQLRVVGPPAVLELCAPWVAPDDPGRSCPSPRATPWRWRASPYERWPRTTMAPTSGQRCSTTSRTTRASGCSTRATPDCCPCDPQPARGPFLRHRAGRGDLRRPPVPRRQPPGPGHLRRDRGHPPKVRGTHRAQRGRGRPSVPPQPSDVPTASAPERLGRPVAARRSGPEARDRQADPPLPGSHTRSRRRTLGQVPPCRGSARGRRLGDLRRDLRPASRRP